MRKEMTMNEDTTEVSRVKWVLGGAALGALTMFLMDPDRGNRRRALAKDKIYSAAVRTRKQIDAKSRDLANRAKGLQAEARHLAS
jgi:gas vesicle protein